jgi:predicted Zn-dependent protease
MSMPRWLPALVVAGVVAGALGGCAANDGKGFTAFMSPDQERRIGAEEHPKVLARFGGVYGDAALGAYVAAIGGRLAANTGQPAADYRFTVLNSPVVNAFALPGGYVYVTRGLVALANDEAELAGVIAHEIGHVTARHSAQRYSQAVAVTLGTIALGVLLGSDAINQAAQIGGELYMQGFSRENEYEADSLGVRTLAQTGYEPQGAARFLQSLERESALANRIAGKPGAEREVDFFASHPRTVDRVERAIAEAGRLAQNPIARRDEFLNAVDGMLYGDDPAQGFVRGRRFLHPQLGFAFEAPPGFRLINTEKAVVAPGPGGAVIRFDHESDARRAAGARDALDYLRRVWGARADLANLERIVINGLDAATARSQAQGPKGPLDVRLVVIRANPGAIYRFMFLTPTNVTRRLTEDLQRTTYSFRLLSDSEAREIRPHRINVVSVRGADTVASLAAQMPFDDFQIERFRALNGLGEGQSVAAGQRVKLIAE